MAEEIWVNIDGAATGWKEVTEVYVNIDGSTTGWKEVTEGYVNTDGSTTGWKQFWDSTVPPTITDVQLVRRRKGTPCAAELCESCVYWTIADGASGDVVDIARSENGGTYVTWGDDVPYDNDETVKCSDYSWTGDDLDVSTAGCRRDDFNLQARLTLFRASVQQDEDFSGIVYSCNAEA